MTKIDPLQASFNAGELSPRLHARVDFIKYPSGLEECQNLIPLPEGGLTRRPGTRFVAEIVDSTKKGRLFGFEATAEQHHVLELGENKVRFYFRQGQQVVLATDAVITNGLFPSDISDWDDRSTGGAGNQISHDATNNRLTLETNGVADTDIGWAEQDVTTTDLSQEHVIKFEVIGDPGDKIEFQVGSSSTGSEILSPVERLVGFHCVAFTPTVSPFFIQFRNRGRNADKDVQIDNVSIIDNSALEIDSPYIEEQLFQIMGAQSNDLKYLFRSGVAPYKLERRALASWSLVRVAWQDGPYITQNSEATTLTPAATSGVAVAVTASSTIGINGGRGFLATDVGRLIRIDNGSAWGWGIIVGLTSTTIVDVHVKKAFAATSATTDWRLGAWSDTTGWPKTGGFFEQRLYVASTNDQSQTLWGSQTGDFENFKPDDDNNVVEDDDALDFTLSADSVGEIRWLSAGEDTLAIGTAGGEWVPSASGIVITPLDITIRRQTTHGSALIAPLRVDHVVLFVQKAKRKIREFVFNFEFDSFLAPDITRLAQHITAPGIDAMAFQQEPDSLVWAIRLDGKLLSLTFRRDEDVVGWARHDIGGKGSTGAAASFEITGGSAGAANQITSITVAGEEILAAPVTWTESNEETAQWLKTIVSAFYKLPPGPVIKSGDISAENANPLGLSFSSDGTKMYSNESAGSTDKLYQYTLSTAFDPETKTYDNVFFDYGGSSGFESETINGGDGVEQTGFDDVVGHTWNLDGTELWFCESTYKTIYKVNVDPAWDLNTATHTYKQRYRVGAVPWSMNFSFNGEKIYIFTNSERIEEHILSLAYNVQTAVDSGVSVNPGALSGGVFSGGVYAFFAANGYQFYVVDRLATDTIYQFTMAARGELSTSIYAERSLLVAAQDNSPTAIYIPADGRFLFMVGLGTDTVYRYEFGTVLYSITVSGSTITISTVSGFTGAGSEVVITTTGDMTVDSSSFSLVSTGVSLSESVVTISGNDDSGQVQNSEDRDEVWVTVKRTINGTTKRYVEFFEGYYDDLLHDQEDAYYADSIITYDGILTNTITGLSHLEGETVKVWGDGSILPDVVVSNGQVTLATAVKVAQIGLAYTHRLKTLKIEGGNPAGTAVGKKKRINGITFVLLNSHTLTFGPDDDNKFKKDFRLVSSPMDAGVPLFTGEQFYEFDSGLATDTRIIVESDDPAPFTLLAMIPEVKVNPSK